MQRLVIILFSQLSYSSFFNPLATEEMKKINHTANISQEKNTFESLKEEAFMEEVLNYIINSFIGGCY